MPTPLVSHPFTRFSLLFSPSTAARVIGAPEAGAAGASSGTAEEEGITGTAPVTAAELNSSTAAASTPATTKANKRTSVFGSLFGKKEAPSAGSAVPAATEFSPVASTKDEPSAVSSAAPQLDNPVNETSAAPTLETKEAPAAAAAAPDTTTPATTTPTNNRRSSFFSNLGTKKEKKAGTTSGDELTDGEGKKSGGFGGLLRKASRAQPKNAAPSTTTEPLPKDSLITNGTSNAGASEAESAKITADEPSGMTGTHEQTPVSASA